MFATTRAEAKSRTVDRRFLCISGATLVRDRSGRLRTKFECTSSNVSRVRPGCSWLLNGPSLTTCGGSPGEVLQLLRERENIRPHQKPRPKCGHASDAKVPTSRRALCCGQPLQVQRVENCRAHHVRVSASATSRLAENAEKRGCSHPTHNNQMIRCSRRVIRAAMAVARDVDCTCSFSTARWDVQSTTFV